MHLRALFLLALAPQLLGAQAHGPGPAERPFLVLIKTNPWLSVIGSDSPSFVLYPTRWAVEATDSVPFLAGRLGPQAYAAIQAAVESAAFGALDSLYTDGSYTDAPSTILFVQRPDGPKVVSVYAAGTLDNPASHVPGAFAAVLKRLVEARLDKPIPWLPAQTELLLEETAQTGDLLEWPKGWKAPVRYPGFFITYLGPDKVTDLLSMATGRSERPIWLRGEQRFSPLGLHFVFPGEDLWMHTVHFRRF